MIMKRPRQLGERITVSTAGTLTRRMRGNKPSVFNVVRIEQDAVTVTALAVAGQRASLLRPLRLRAHCPWCCPAAGSDRAVA